MGESDSLGNPTAPKWFQHMGESDSLGNPTAPKLFQHMGESDSLGNPTASKWFRHMGPRDSDSSKLVPTPDSSTNCMFSQKCNSDSLSHPNLGYMHTSDSLFFQKCISQFNIKQYSLDIYIYVPICMKSKSYCAARVLQSSSRGHPIIQNSYSKYQHGDLYHKSLIYYI